MILLTVIMLLATAGLGISWGIRDYLYNLRAEQYLQLADDSSLPVMKKDYLIKYKEAVNKHVYRDSARYIFKRERLTKAAQMGVLDSLIKRLEDVSVLTPDSFAYQQGMEQVTGQEFDHTMGEINGVFKACYMRDSFFIRFAVPVFTIVFGILTFIFGIGILACIDV